MELLEKLDLQLFAAGNHPDVYVQEQATTAQSIPSINTAVGAYIGIAQKGPVGKAVPINSFANYQRIFGNYSINSYLTYVLAAHFSMAGNNLTYVERVTHNNLFPVGQNIAGTGSTQGGLVVAMPVGGTPNSTSALNVSFPAANTAVAVGTLLQVGGQVAVVQAVTATGGIYSTALQLLTFQVPLAHGAGVNTVVNDWDPLTLRQSAPAQGYLLDKGGTGTVQLSLLLSSVYDGSFYNGLGYSISGAPAASSTYVSQPTPTSIMVVSSVGYKKNQIIQLGTGGSPTTQEYLTINNVVGNQIFFTTPILNSYTAGAAVLEQSFNLAIYSYGQQVEYYAQVSMSKISSRYIVNVINNQVSGSQYVTATDLLSANGAGNAPANTTTIQYFANGQDGIQNPVLGNSLMQDQDYIGGTVLNNGFNAFDNINDSILHVAVPGVTTMAVTAAITNYVLNRNNGNPDAMYIIDSPLGSTPTSLVTLIGNLPSSITSYGAMYYPWVLVPDPIGSGRNATKLIPPCGYAIGCYAQTDKKRGVFKAPAGLSTLLLGALGLEYKVANTDQDNLNPIGVNCIRSYNNSGICIMGARTLSSANGDTSTNLVNVRRILLQIEKELAIGTRWAIFEPDDTTLYQQLYINVNAYLRSKWQQRYFYGKSPAQAFFVTCDTTNNSPADRAANQVNITVGVVPTRAAEFILFTVGQSDTTSTVSELSVVGSGS